MQWLQGMRVGSLCSGYGGLDLAVEQMGGQVVWQCENDKWARVVLRERWPKLKCYRDLRDTDWSKVAKVDVVVAGFPCQPVSAAGLQKGMDDERWLWPWIWRVVDAVGAGVVLLENVPGLLSANGGAAMGEVLGTLAERGWDAEWGCGGAGEVGGCHRRERWWCVAADPDRQLDDGRWNAGTGGGGEPTDDDLVAADPDQPRLARLKPARRRDMSAGCGEGDVVLLPTPTVKQGRNATAGRSPDAQFNTGTTLCDIAFADQWGKFAPSIGRHALTFDRPAPSPTEPNRSGSPVLSPRFVEWMMGLDDGWVTGLEQIARTNQLKILGNGVVPAQAVYNYNRLIERLHDEAT